MLLKPPQSIMTIQNIEDAMVFLHTDRQDKRITNGVHCSIKMSSTTGNVDALRHDLQNGVKHYFGDHSHCKLTFCKHTTDTSNVIFAINIKINLCLGLSLT